MEEFEKNIHTEIIESALERDDPIALAQLLALQASEYYSTLRMNGVEEGLAQTLTLDYNASLLDLT